MKTEQQAEVSREKGADGKQAKEKIIMGELYAVKMNMTKTSLDIWT